MLDRLAINQIHGSRCLIFRKFDHHLNAQNQKKIKMKWLRKESKEGKIPLHASQTSSPEISIDSKE